MALSCVWPCRGFSLVLLCRGFPPNGATGRVGFTFMDSSQPRWSWLSSRHYSPSRPRLGIGRHVATTLQRFNGKYERFLQRRFPRFYILYHTFVTGFRRLFQDGKEVQVIRRRMITNSVQLQDLPYRDMEKLRQFRRDIFKAIPLALISIPPLANYLVFVLMYLFPRQLLIPHFWSPQQQAEFQRVYHSHRVQQHGPLLKELQRAASQVKDSHLRGSVLALYSKVQSGVHPSVPEIHGVRGLFSGPPLGIRRLNADQMRQLCPLLFLTPLLPSVLIGQRLKNHAVELLLLDRALRRLGLHRLTQTELRQACYTRGLDSYSLTTSQCQEWLSQWLQFSCHLKESEASLLLYSMVLLSANYPKPPGR